MAEKIEITLWPKFLEAAITPVAKEAGERLSDIISLAATPIVKAKAKRDLKMKLFLEDLEKELKKIPEDNITEPPLSIVGPALEDLFKYYMDEDHIVAAFKKLIAASMDAEKQGLIHPIHTWMIRQMSPTDARFFEKMADCSAVFTSYVGSRSGEDYHYQFLDVWVSHNNIATIDLVDEEFRESLTAFQAIGLVSKLTPRPDDYYYEFLTREFEKNLALKPGFALLPEHVSDMYMFTDYGNRLAQILGVGLARGEVLHV